MLTMFIDHPARVYNRDQILNTVFDDGELSLTEPWTPTLRI